MTYLFFGYAAVFVLLAGYVFYLTQRIQRLERSMEKFNSNVNSGRERP